MKKINLMLVSFIIALLLSFGVVSALNITPAGLEPNKYIYKRGHLVWAVSHWTGDINSLLIALKQSCNNGFYTQNTGGNFKFIQSNLVTSSINKTIVACSSKVYIPEWNKNIGQNNWQFVINHNSGDLITFDSLYYSQPYTSLSYGLPYFPNLTSY